MVTKCLSVFCGHCIVWSLCINGKGCKICQAAPFQPDPSFAQNRSLSYNTIIQLLGSGTKPLLATGDSDVTISS